jgi:hypothetical protein
MGLCANAVQVERRSKLFAFLVLNGLLYSVVRIPTLPEEDPPGGRWPLKSGSIVILDRAW